MTIETADEKKSLELLNSFRRLPKRFAGLEAEARVLLHSNEFSPAGDYFCGPLDLPLGDTLIAYAKVEPGGFSFSVLAVGDVAEKAAVLDKGDSVLCRVRAKFGIRREFDYGPNGAVERQEPVHGLLITEVLSG